MSLDALTISDFKGYFTRDFVYNTDPKAGVTDNDLTKAFAEARMHFNDSLFSTDGEIKIAYMYLAAHYLCHDLQMAAQGINSVGYNPVSQRTVGSVSESYSIPEWMIKDPVLSFYSTTRYGQKYLSIIKPLLIGNVAVHEGWTTP
jgi:hypothetical protein